MHIDVLHKLASLKQRFTLKLRRYILKMYKQSVDFITEIQIRFLMFLVPVPYELGMQPHPLAEILLLKLITFGQNYGEIEVKFGQ